MLCRFNKFAIVNTVTEIIGEERFTSRNVPENLRLTTEGIIEIVVRSHKTASKRVSADLSFDFKQFAENVEQNREEALQLVRTVYNMILGE